MNILSIPHHIVQRNVFQLIESRDLFRIRGVCGHFQDLVKKVWCFVVKDEMLE